MLLTKLVCWIYDKVGEEPHPIDYYTKSRNTKMWRQTLCHAATQMWGTLENKGWKIVMDRTLIGFHAVNTDGEVIELR